MHVARAGGQVRQQEVQRTPPGLVDHLFQGTDGHGSAPQQGVGGFDEETDRHQPDVHRFGRDDAVRTLLGDGFGNIPFHAEHFGLRRSVDVGVEDAHAEPHVPQRDGQVGRDGGLAYPTLARGDGDYFGDAARGGLQFGFGTRSRPALLDHDEHLCARKRLAQKRFGLVLDLHGERVAGLGEAQHDGDFAFGGRRMFDESARNDVLSRFGMDDRCEQAFDFFFHAVRKVCL